MIYIYIHIYIFLHTNFPYTFWLKQKADTLKTDEQADTLKTDKPWQSHLRPRQSQLAARLCLAKQNATPFKVTRPASQPCCSSTKHQASSIKHQASSSKQQASSIKHQASTIKHRPAHAPPAELSPIWRHPLRTPVAKKPLPL